MKKNEIKEYEKCLGTNLGRSIRAHPDFRGLQDFNGAVRDLGAPACYHQLSGFIHGRLNLRLSVLTRALLLLNGGSGTETAARKFDRRLGEMLRTSIEKADFPGGVDHFCRNVSHTLGLKRAVSTLEVEAVISGAKDQRLSVISFLYCLAVLDEPVKKFLPFAEVPAAEARPVKTVRPPRPTVKEKHEIKELERSLGANLGWSIKVHPDYPRFLDFKDAMREPGLPTGYHQLSGFIHGRMNLRLTALTRALILLKHGRRTEMSMFSEFNRQLGEMLEGAIDAAGIPLADFCREVTKKFSLSRSFSTQEIEAVFSGAQDARLSVIKFLYCLAVLDEPVEKFLPFAEVPAAEAGPAGAEEGGEKILDENRIEEYERELGARVGRKLGPTGRFATLVALHDFARSRFEGDFYGALGLFIHGKCDRRKLAVEKLIFLLAAVESGDPETVAESRSRMFSGRFRDRWDRVSREFPGGVRQFCRIVKMKYRGVKHLSPGMFEEMLSGELNFSVPLYLRCIAAMKDDIRKYFPKSYSLPAENRLQLRFEKSAGPVPESGRPSKAS